VLLFGLPFPPSLLPLSFAELVDASFPNPDELLVPPQAARASNE
jgi:hypothetical protein